MAPALIDGYQQTQKGTREPARRGPVIPVPKAKTRVTIRLDEDVVAWFRGQVEAAGGGNYQALINDTLRAPVSRWKKPCDASFARK